MATAIETTGRHSLGSMVFSPEGPTALNTSSFRSNQAKSLSPTSPQIPDPSSARLSPSAQLPDFVFPARAPPNSAPSSFSRATGRRPTSAIELGSKSRDDSESRPSRLPDFSFNASSGLVSPPLSPESPQSPTQSITSRTGGFRRGPSELLGGDAPTGVALLGSSPPKVSSPSSLGPSAGRKGHSHRRSAAISSHDLSFLLKPSNPNAVKIGGSAPTTPCDFEPRVSLFTKPEDVSTPPINAELNKQHDSGSASSPSDSPTTKNTNRNRVGFSDTLEFIPRPLSLVSNDTSSTVRGHSVSGSLSSIVSAGTSSPTPREQRSSPAPVQRPRTAGPVLDGVKTSDDPLGSRRSISTPTILDLSASLPSSPAPSTPKWAFFSRSGESSPSRSRPVSAASSEKGAPVAQPVPTPPSPDKISPNIPAASPEPHTTSRRASVSSRKSSKKQKKVKSWAGSILSRKSRPHSQKKKGLSRRSPTPPLRSYAQMCDGESLGSKEIEGVDGPGNVRPKPELQTDFASWKPRHVRALDEETMSPMIDLDAALGPFNTPSAYDPEWDALQKGTTTKRRMHSAAGMGGFIGPGMHYHRRAESAPEMVPFDNLRFGIHRLGSSSTMADVFEEDEEDDDWEDTKASDKGDSIKDDEEEESVLGIDIKVVDAESTSGENAMDFTVEEQRGVKRKGSGLSDAERRQVSSSMKSEHSSTSLKDEPILEESPTSNTLVEGSDELLAPRPESRAHSSHSTAHSTAGSSLPRVAKELSPVEVSAGLLSPVFLTPTSPNSTVPSPFPSPRSPYSYDAQRISTAPSSITDERGGYESLLLGEPGPEYRMSVDEAPSIGSSISTLTRDTVWSGSPGVNNPQFRDGQRSASLSSAAVTRKRSSMASLSRLISSSHGEKSKLSIESRPHSTIEVGRKEKESKGKRISRMMQFWKSKE